MITVFFGGLVSWIFVAAFCVYVAWDKGHAWWWGLVAALFHGFGFLVLVAIPSRHVCAVCGHVVRPWDHNDGPHLPIV